MIELSLHSIGTQAHAICQQHQYDTSEHRAIITAVFDRSAYITIGRKLICIVMFELGASPLSLQLQPSFTKLPRLYTGDAVAICGKNQSLQLGAQARINLHTVNHFSGSVTRSWVSSPGTGIAQKIRTHLHDSGHGLYAYIVLGKVPAENTIERVLCQQIAPAIALLRQWLALPLDQAQSLPPPESICALVGAGPGLTPSGDDVLCGVMCTLHLLGRGYAADEMWTQLQPSLANRTNAISAAFLRQASQAHASEPCLSALNAIISTPNNGKDNNIGNEFETVQEQAATISAWLDGVGETSGWDFLAGAYLVFEATGVN